MTATLAIPDAERLLLEEYFEREWNTLVRHAYTGGQSIAIRYTTENYGLVEYYARQDDGTQWLFAGAVGLEAVLPLLGFDIPLREIYALVEWETNHSEAGAPPTA